MPGAPGGIAPPAQPGGSAGLPVNRSPLRLGLLYVNNDAASSAGVDNGNTFTVRRVLEALVAAFRARGGLAGRRIIPIYAELKSSSASFSSDAAAACSRFVEDEHVQVVISELGLASDQMAACFNKARLPRIQVDYALGDLQLYSSSPYLIAPATLTVDRRETDLLRHFVATGFLSKKNKIGFVVEGCPFDTRAFQRTVLPEVRRLGLQFESYQTTCFDGIQNLSTLASDAQSAALRFNTNHVDRVTFVSETSEGNLMFLFSQAADSQQYFPRYMLSSLVSPALQPKNSPHRQLANARGMGWLPSLDTGARTSSGGFVEKNCLTDFHKSGAPSPSSAADYYYLFSGCDGFWLLNTLLNSTRGFADGPSLLNALARLGTSYIGASMLQGATDFRSGRREGPTRAREFVWKGSCSCFVYSGPSFGL